MTIPKIEFKSETIDGTEYRNVLLRARVGDIKFLADSLANKEHGFASFSNPRVELLDDGQIMIVLPSNSGTTDSYIYLGLDIFIPLTADEVAATDPKEPNAPST